MTAASHANKIRSFVISRILPAILILAVLYANLAALLYQSHIRYKLPAPWPLIQLFRVHSVFDGYRTKNFSYEAEAYITRPTSEGQEAGWEPFDLFRYFPQARGEANRRLWMNSYRNDPQRVQEAYRRLVSQLKHFSRRDDPGAMVERIRVYSVTWPVDERGYLARYAERTRELVIEE